MDIKITECACCGNRDSSRFIQKSDGYICKTCGVWFRYDTEEEKAGCMDGRRRLKNYRFDDAREAFMEVLDKYPNSIDALWGLLLARYGVVFVKGFFDDTTEPIYCFPEYDEYGERRFQDERAYKKIMRLLEERDEDFRLSDFYESKAKEIDRAIAKYSECKKSTDVDVFICVKISAATEEDPKKSGYTKDYEYALKVYKEMEKRGVNAFFSFVTLKNNVESDDLIWVNLVKSKKMLLIGSEEEYLDSVWVKSEWKRWLYLGREKNLYICSMKHNNESPKSILPHELASLHPQVYTLDTYEKMINELCEGVSAKKTAEEKKEPVKVHTDAEEKMDGRIEYRDGRVEVLKYGITEIAERKYAENRNIYKVFLPNSVKKICDCAFWESSLFEITIPNSVTEIGSSVFNFCKNLREITIPDSVTRLGSSFQECPSLKSATLSCGLTRIESGMFVNSGIRSIVIPEGVTMIGQQAFSGCELLKTAHIPKSVVYIEGGAFDYMPLKSLRKVTYAGSRADWKKIDIVGWCDSLKGNIFQRAMIWYNCKK